MLLVLINYKKELIIDNYLNQIPNEIKYFNESKWSIFGYKVLKYILENKTKFKLIVHFGSCGGIKNNIWNIYKIDRTFLYDKHIIDNQKFKFWSYKLENIENQNIVTKFKLWNHWNNLYDFSNIYDLETFWIAQISNLVTIPIISIKWVTDDNSYFQNNDNDLEIQKLLNLHNNSNENEFYSNIKIINNKFCDLYCWEIKKLYNKLSEDKSFYNYFLHWKKTTENRSQ